MSPYTKEINDLFYMKLKIHINDNMYINMYD